MERVPKWLRLLLWSHTAPDWMFIVDSWCFQKRPRKSSGRTIREPLRFSRHADRASSGLDPCITTIARQDATVEGGGVRFSGLYPAPDTIGLRSPLHSAVRACVTIGCILGLHRAQNNMTKPSQDSVSTQDAFNTSHEPYITLSICAQRRKTSRLVFRLPGPSHISPIGDRSARVPWMEKFVASTHRSLQAMNWSKGVRRAKRQLCIDPM